MKPRLFFILSVLFFLSGCQFYETSQGNESTPIVDKADIIKIESESNTKPTLLTPTLDAVDTSIGKIISTPVPTSTKLAIAPYLPGETPTPVFVDHRLGITPSALALNQPIIYSDVVDGETHLSIFVSDLLFSQVTRLTNDPVPYGEPQWSPDGSQIAFTSERDGNKEIFLMNADGSDQRRLTEHPDFDVNPRWSPDSRYIIFRRIEVGVSSQLFAIDTTNNKIEQITKLNITPNMFDISPSGKNIVFSGRLKYHSQQSHIYVMDMSDGSYVQISEFKYGTANSPLWSPNNLLIAYLSNYLVENADDEGYELHVINPDGTDLKRLTKIGDIGHIFSFDWSPDSKKIICSTSKGTYLLNIASGEAEQIFYDAYIDIEWFWISNEEILSNDVD